MSWEEKRLGDVVSVKKRINSGSALPYVGMEHISSGTGEFLGELDPVAVKSSTFFFEPGQLLYGRLRPYLNKVLLPEFKGHCSTEVFPIQPSSAIDKKFLFYWFTSDSTVSRIDATCTGARMPRANVHEVLDFEIPVPPLPEQQRIVGKLDAAFAALTEAQAHVERNRANARELFESYLNGVFTEEKRDWPERKLGELTERITKGSSPKWQGISYVDEPGVLFVTSENVGEFSLLLDKPKYVEERFNAKDRKSILRNGDVLTNIVGASIGRTAIYNIDTVANINQAVCLIRCLPEMLSNAYLTYLLNSPFFKAILHDNEVDNARANLSLGFFSNLAIPVPSMNEQKAVVDKMNRFREEYLKLETTYQQKLSELAGLRKSILGAAFRGEL